MTIGGRTHEWIQPHSLMRAVAMLTLVLSIAGCYPKGRPTGPRRHPARTVVWADVGEPGIYIRLGCTRVVPDGESITRHEVECPSPIESTEVTLHTPWGEELAGQLGEDEASTFHVDWARVPPTNEAQLRDKWRLVFGARTTFWTPSDDAIAALVAALAGHGDDLATAPPLVEPVAVPTMPTRTVVVAAHEVRYSSATQVADLASLGLGALSGLIAFEVYPNSSDEASEARFLETVAAFAGVGLTCYALAAPSVHLVHRNFLGAGKSFLLRVGAGLVASAAGVGITFATESPVLGGVLALFALAGGSALDAHWNAHVWVGEKRVTTTSPPVAVGVRF